MALQHEVEHDIWLSYQLRLGLKYFSYRVEKSTIAFGCSKVFFCAGSCFRQAFDNEYLVQFRLILRPRHRGTEASSLSTEEWGGVNESG